MHDLTEEDLAPVLRVVVFADKPLSVQGFASRNSAEHIVVHDVRKRGVVQPLAVEPFDETVWNAFGGHIELNGMTATFPMDEVIALRRSNGGSGEFKITIVGVGTSERTFHIKRKHFKRLP